MFCSLTAQFVEQKTFGFLQKVVENVGNTFFIYTTVTNILSFKKTHPICYKSGLIDTHIAIFKLPACIHRSTKKEVNHRK